MDTDALNLQNNLVYSSNNRYISEMGDKPEGEKISIEERYFLYMRNSESFHECCNHIYQMKAIQLNES